MAERRAGIVSPSRFCGSAGRVVAGLSLGACLAALAGCGSSDVNAVLRQLVEDRGLIDPSTTVTIEIANQTPGVEERLTLRIDGLDQVFVCPAAEGSCEFPLEQIPDTIEAIQEERYDGDGAFAGGRVLEGQPAFAFDRSDYGQGSIVLYLLGESSAEAKVL
jgi:hypothetical protein